MLTFIIGGETIEGNYQTSETYDIIRNNGISK